MSMILAADLVRKAALDIFLTNFLVSKSKISTEKSSKDTANRELVMGKRGRWVEALWSRTVKNTDCSTGLLARPFACGTVNY